MSMKLLQAAVPLRHPSQMPAEPHGSLAGAVQGLVFDTGGVLYDATVFRRWLLKVLARLGLHTNYRSFFHIWDHDFLADVHCGRREYWEAFGSFLLTAGLSRGQIEELQVACQAQRREWLATARPLPGVRSAIGRLRQCGVPMAVICDCELPAAAIREQLERLGLGAMFAVVVSSREIGRAKPDAACYLAALDGLGLTAHEAAFVGHDGEELAAAARLGMQAIGFNCDPEAEADVYLGRFDELVELVLSRTPLAVAG